MGILERFQANNRAKLQELIDEEVLYMHDLYITKTTLVMLEANIEQDKIKELLVKYWDLRPSEASSFIQKALEQLE